MLDEKRTIKFPALILVSLMAVKIAAQCFLIHPSFDLQRDEYLHLDLANHPAWGYMSVPPVTSWIAMVIKLLGNDVFWVKFFPALFGAFTMFFCWKIVEEQGGRLFAKVIVALAVLFSVLLRINTLFQPNSFEIMAWTAAFYFLVRYLHRGTIVNLYVLAFVFAIAFLNKYNVIFPMAGIGLAWLLLPQHRLLWTPHFVGAVVLFLLLIAPNIYWQYTHGIPFVKHMRELADSQLVNMERSNFIKEQVLFFMHPLFLSVLGIIGFFRFKSFSPYRVFPLGMLITLGIYVWFHAKGYYAAGLYPALFAFGAAYLDHYTYTRNRIWRPVTLGLVVVLFIPFLLVAFPYASAEIMAASPEKYRKLGLLRWEDGKEHALQQDFADMLGWREMAYLTDSAVNLLNEKDHTLIIADNYGEAGAVNYHGTTGLRAVSFNADYLYWFPIGKPVKHIVRIISESNFLKDPGLSDERSFCDTMILVGEVTNTYAREKCTKVFVMKNLKGDVWPVIEKEIEEKIRD